MAVKRAAFNVSGYINAVIDGVAMSMPDDMLNRDRRKLAEWEKAGGVIAPYEPPPEVAPLPDPRDVKIADHEARLAKLEAARITTRT